jgi:hypothetical protein
VRPGHAYVEVSGARIDVGQEARLALVRHALGLDGAADTDSTADALPQNDMQLLGDAPSELPLLNPDPPTDAQNPPPVEKE